MTGRAAVLLALLSSAAAAQPAPWPEAPTHLDFGVVADLKQSSMGAKLNNGSEANPADWPATLFLEKACTATLIGAQTLLLAAHCIQDHGTVAFRRGGTLFSGACNRPEGGFPAKPDADYALCLIEPAVTVEDGYENVSLQTGRLVRDRRLLLTGYGCTKPEGDSDGKFRTGPTFIEYPPGTLVDYPPGTGGRYPNYMVTYAALRRGDAFLCKGDSGGGVYLELPGAPRQLVAVNSSYDLPGQGVSFLSVLGSTFGKDFLKAWAHDHKGQKLCGIDGDAPNCRFR